MKIMLKTLCSTVAIMLGFTAYAANAQEAQEETTKPRAVLFKIHDIKPVENADGVVTDCDFLVTFYNRTTDSFRQAKLNFGWNDTVSGRYMSTEEQPAQQQQPQMYSRNSKQQPVMEISTIVEMPSLGSYKQSTVKASVKTEKCFLLLDKLNFEVQECNMIGKETNASQNSRRRPSANSYSNSGCSNLFEYVDSQNPEYFDEFKNISYSEQERNLAEIKKHDISDINTNNEKIVKNIQDASDLLKGIQ